MLACVLMIVLPSVLSRKTSPNIDRSTSENVSVSQSKRQIAQQLQNTKLRLIFRTHADLADRLGVPQQDIVLNETKDKVWTDTSLECLTPFRGSALVQVPQRTELPGWLITWKLGTTIYEYNTSIKGDWVLCSKIEIPEGVAQYRSSSDN